VCICGLAEIVSPPNTKKGWVRKSQIRKVLYLRKVRKSNKLFKSASTRICGTYLRIPLTFAFYISSRIILARFCTVSYIIERKTVFLYFVLLIALTLAETLVLFSELERQDLVLFLLLLPAPRVPSPPIRPINSMDGYQKC